MNAGEGPRLQRAAQWLDSRARILDCTQRVKKITIQVPKNTSATCKLAISFLSSFCPASPPPTAAAATAAAEAAVKAGVLAESRAHADADDGVSPPVCRAAGTTPEKDGIGLV